jgi:serine/threonine-protein kinase
VDYVLEGSVRWAKSAGGKGRVRISPQLVRVSDDTPVWSETYDREVSDIFEVQTDIATHVVDALGVTLHASEREQLMERPTSNLEAYQYFMRARELVCVGMGGCDEEQVQLLEKAVALDPGFLAAWHDLVRAHVLMYHINLDRTEARLARAKAALNRMEEIDSSHPLTRIARGFYYYHGYRDYDRALVEFQAAVDARPNDADAVYSVALIHRRKGQLDEAAKKFEHTLELDPKNPQYLWELGDTYDGMRKPELALENFERSYALKNDPGTLNEIAAVVLRHYGDTRRARQVVARASDPNVISLLPARTFIFIYERDYASAIANMKRTEIPFPAVRAGLGCWIALTEAERDGREKARPALEAAARQMETFLREAPGDFASRSYLSFVYAYLGRDEDAIREAKLAVDVIAKDAYAGPVALANLAVVYAHTGRAEEALDLIDRLLGMKYEDPLTVVQLRVDPIWDPLRENPKFKELLKRSA